MAVTARRLGSRLAFVGFLFLLMAPTLKLPGLAVIMSPAVRLANAWQDGLLRMVGMVAV